MQRHFIEWLEKYTYAFLLDTVPPSQSSIMGCAPFLPLAASRGVVVSYVVPWVVKKCDTCGLIMEKNGGPPAAWLHPVKTI